MKSSDLSQVRVDPRDATDELLAAVREAVERGGPVKYSKKLYARLIAARVLHPFGIHHWVQYRTFDPGSGRIIVHPRKWVCTNCPKGRYM